MFNIITIGGATRDITFLTDKGRVIETPENLTEQSLLAFEYGAKINSEEVYFNFGGGSCNTAATFSKLGISAAANCRIGNDDDGKSMIKNLEKLGINTELVQIDENRSTGFALVVVNKNGGDRVIFQHKGASNFLEVKSENLAGKSKWIYLTSLAGNWEKDLAEINKAVENGKVKLAWNPGSEQISADKNKLEKTFQNTEILIINKDEAIELMEGDENLKLDFNELNDVSVLSRLIKKRGPKFVVITDGSNGAYAHDGENVLYAPSTLNKKIDSTGAGDSFGSAFVGGYILASDIEKALKYGIINSGSVVSEYGAQNGILGRSEIEKKLGEVKVSWV